MSLTDGPAPKRRKFDGDASPQHVPTCYHQPVAQGHAQAHFGNSHTVNNGPVYYSSNTAQASVESGDQAAVSLMESLAFEQMDARLETISKAHARTCQWLFARDEYKTWRDPRALHEHHGFFWIKGKPGAGKSTLMKCAKQYGEKNHEGIVIAFFFNARGDELERSAQGMYRSLLYQLLEKKPELSSAIAEYKRRAIQPNWYLEALKQLFEAAICALGDTKATCYVDALDECDDEQARDMVESFESFAQSAVGASIAFRVLLSSRHYPHITIDKCIQMTLEGQEGHEADIAEYVRYKLKIGKSQLATEIRDAIRVRASGVFLWVVLVIRILNDCDSRGRTHLLRKRLEGIPDGLSELFEEILQRGTRDLADTLLTYQWILFASRPLKREELYFAIVTSSVDDDWNPEEITVDVMERFLIDSSKGLAETTRGKHPTIQFIHESVREYLVRIGLTFLEPCLAEKLVEQSHDALRRCCHHYLSKSEAELLHAASDGAKKHMSSDRHDIHALRDRISATHPFLSYAVDGILYHANLSHSVNFPQEELVATFPHELWRRLYNLCCQYHTRRLHDTSTLLYTFVSMGAHRLAEIELQMHPTQPRDTGEYYTTLPGAAVANGDEQMMTLLLKHGADPHGRVTSKSKRDCLSFAIEKKDASMVQILVDGGAYDMVSITGRVNVLDLTLEPSIYDFKVTQLMITHGPYSNPLFWSSHLTGIILGRGLLEIKKMLMARLDFISTELANSGSDLDPKDPQNAFVAASSYGSVSLVMKFLDNATLGVGHSMENAIEAAIQQGHVNIVRMLLDHVSKADLDQGGSITTSHQGMTRHRDDPSYKNNALFSAVRERQELIVKLLLERKADTSRCDSSGETVLLAACRCGWYNIAKMLLSYGADVNIMANMHSGRHGNSLHGARYGNSLHCASLHGHPDIVRGLLRQPSMIVDALDSKGEHAIVIAAWRGHFECVQALLEREIPVESLKEAWFGLSSFRPSHTRTRMRTESIQLALAARLPPAIPPDSGPISTANFR